MTEWISTVKAELKRRQALTPKGKHMVTGDIRRISAELYRALDDHSKETVFSYCEALLEEREWALGVIAYDFAYRVRSQYDAADFPVFERWLADYVRDWGDCDDFCTHAFGELLCQNSALILNKLQKLRF